MTDDNTDWLSSGKREVWSLSKKAQLLGYNLWYIVLEEKGGE